MKFVMVVLLITVLTTYGQENVGKSKSGSLLPKKEIPKEETTIPITPQKSESGEMVYYTPFLVASLVYTEPSGNNFLDANEEGRIDLAIKNIGKMPAEDCTIKLIPSVYDLNISITDLSIIPKLNPGEEKLLSIILKANEYISTGQAKYTLKITEKNGFDLEPEKVLIIPTREFQPPILEIVDFGIDDQNRNLKIEKFEKVEVTIRIQNRGETTSQNTRGIVKLGENVVALDVLEEYDLGEMKSGDYKDIKAVIATNTRATEVKLDLSVKEQTGKYSASRSINLPFNVIQKKADEIVIAKGEERAMILEAVLSKLDIAENIPIADSIKENAVAVIIGNKDYLNAPNVEFALNDAAIVKNYVKQAFGYLEENIIYIPNAKQSDFFKIFGNDQDHKGQLFGYTKKGLSEVFIYYSGHGAPDPESKQGFLVPIDCDPNRVSLNGYSLRTLYDNLDKTAKEKEIIQLTLVIDACFSGNSESGSLLTNISPIYLSVEKRGMTYPNSTMLTSSMGDQVSTWYREKKQSLFTYFFLKGLKGEADINKDNIITTKELYDYTADEINGVPYWSRRLNPGRTQTPTFSGKDYEIFK